MPCRIMAYPIHCFALIVCFCSPSFTELHGELDMYQDGHLLRKSLVIRFAQLYSISI